MLFYTMSCCIYKSKKGSKKYRRSGKGYSKILLKKRGYFVCSFLKPFGKIMNGCWEILINFWPFFLVRHGMCFFVHSTFCVLKNICCYCLFFKWPNCPHACKWKGSCWSGKSTTEKWSRYKFTKWIVTKKNTFKF